MLITRPRSKTYDETEFNDIHNYYESLVHETVLELDGRARKDNDFLADVSCVALNHLPPRYIRHDVDMNFYMSPIERDEIEKKVKTAVTDAIAFVTEREHKTNTYN